MKRYEYKIVEVKASAWSMQSARSQDAFLEMLNREGRSGWQLVTTHQPSVVPLRSVLLQREVD